MVLTMLALVLLGGCATPPEEPAEPALPENQIAPGLLANPDLALKPMPCWFSVPKGAPKTDCFRMYVPEIYDDPEATMINFPVVRLQAKDRNSGKSPVLHLGGGGPGNPIGIDANSAGNWLWYWYQDISVVNGRDLYLIDPRGVGMAEPVLVCREYIPAFLASLSKNLSVSDEVAWNIEVNKSCVARLQREGIDLNGYNSVNVARDVENLRRALGVSQWNLYGVSYGSRYALTVAREYPESVESMVLDAAVFPNVRYMDNYSDNLEKAFARLIEFCTRDATCNRQLVNPSERFWRLVEKLKRTPLRTTIKHPDLDMQINLVLNGERFLSVFFTALYDADKFRELPQIISSLENNQLGIFEANVNNWLAFQTDDDYGDASAAAHFCYEESPFIDYQAALNNAYSMRHELSEPSVAQLEFNQAQCERWPTIPAGDIEGQPVQTEIPTLLLHGALDPVLPVEDLEKQLIHFARVDYQIFNDMSHSIVGIHPCGEAIARAFYDHKLDFRSYLNCKSSP